MARQLYFKSQLHLISGITGVTDFHFLDSSSTSKKDTFHKIGAKRLK